MAADRLRSDARDDPVSEADEIAVGEPSDGLADPRAVLDTLPAVVGYYDLELRNRLANRAYVEFFGLTPREILGRHIREVIGPQLYALNRVHMERALAGEPQLFDRTVIDHRGEPRHMQVSYVPDIVDGSVRGFAVLLTDITARQLAERAHVAAEARFRGLLESAPDAMVIIKAEGEGEIVLINAQAERLFGYTREELLGKGIEVLLPERFRDLHADRRSSYAADPHARLMGAGLALFARHRDGSEFPIEVTLGPLRSAEGLLLSSAIRDITDRKRVEDELHRSREQLAEAERVARIGSLEWTLTNDQITWSDGLLALHGLTREEFNPHSALTLNTSTPRTASASKTRSRARSRSDRCSRLNTAQCAPTVACGPSAAVAR